MVPLGAVAHYRTPGYARSSVNHKGQLPAVTISFNLEPGTLAQAWPRRTIDRRRRPPAAHAGDDPTAASRGRAKAFPGLLVGGGPILILAAITAVYIILGMLYESMIHPLTILSTLPSAGVWGRSWRSCSRATR